MSTRGRRARVDPAMAAVAMLVVAALVATLTLAPMPAQAQTDSLVISEFLAANDTGLLDEDGAASDWIEIHNTGSNPVTLNGWSLSDDPAGATAWTFPPVDLAAGEYLVVFASGKNRNDPASELHTDFGLAKSGETLSLRAPDQSIASFVDFGQQFTDISAAATTNGTLAFFDPPTPGAANGPPLVGFNIEPPTISPERGIIAGPTAVTLTTAVAGATVRYTIDGSVPTAESPIATGPIDITQSTTVRAASFTIDGVSVTATSSYVLLADIIAQPDMDIEVTQSVQYGDRLEGSLQSVPSFYLTMDADPIDENYQLASVEWLDGANSFQIDAGIKLFGNASLRDAKKNYRLKFSSEFGPTELRHDFYPDVAYGIDSGIVPTDVFDQIELRAGAGDSNMRTSNDRTRSLQMRNPLADDVMLAMGMPNPHNRFVHVYINGEYRGMYTLRERFDADFLASYVGGNADDYDAINKNLAYDGTATTWDEMRANPTWANLSNQLDVDAFLDYIIFNFYSGTIDWLPEKNWAAVGPSDPASPIGWLFYNKDFDNGLSRHPDTLEDNKLDQPGPGGLFGALLLEADPEFVEALQQAIARNLTNGGPLTPGPMTALLERRIAQAAEPLIADSARWGNCNQFCTRRNQVVWDPDDEWTNHLNYLLDTWIPQRPDIVLDQMRVAGWLPIEAPTLSPCCEVTAGQSVTISTGDGPGDIVYTTNGSDPRLVGGSISPAATVVSDASDTDVPITAPTRVIARVKRGDVWSAAQSWDLTLAGATAPVILNEWNAVGPTEVLTGGDATLGTIAGNGGDWFELVVVDDHVDLRGWSIDIASSGVLADTLTFTQDPLLADVRSGTIITIAEDLAEDPSYDPARNDWTINLRAAADATGTYVTAENFPVNHQDWQITIRQASGVAVFGPAGEGVAPLSGVSATEIGELEADPSALITPTSLYDDGNSSTFGAPNSFDDRLQDFSPLRAAVAPAGDVNCGAGLSVVDALLIAQFSVGTRTSSDCPLTDPSTQINAGNGDINNDGRVNVIDALLVAQCTVGIPHPFCPSG